jgi:hypothetical protein
LDYKNDNIKYELARRISQRLRRRDIKIEFKG